MTSAILAKIIIMMCQGDTSTYYVQGYAQDCHHYYVNCAVGYNGEVTEQTLKRCQDDKPQAKKRPAILEE
jgi:hypothetical protein